MCSDAPEPECSGSPQHAEQNHSYSRRSQFAGSVQGLPRRTPTQAANKPTAEDTWIDERYGVLSISAPAAAAEAAADADEMVAENIGYANYIESRQRFNGTRRPNGALPPPNEDANRPKASLLTACAAAAI